MLKIRLRRMGAIRQPHYRIVVADARAPRDGAFIESLGSYNPLTDPATINIDVTRYEEWKQKGAQPTEAVVSLVRQYNRAVRQGTQAPTPLTKKAQRARTAAAAAAGTEAPIGTEDEMAAQSPGGGDEPIEAGTGGVTGIGASVAPSGVEGEDISLAEAMAPSVPGETTSDPMITGTGPGGQTGETANN
ncbi:MAG TPA: 30S ribosomal protein S16 [Chloroflexia bacterium]|jgi:small subunit ribosomal protein S16